MGDRPLAIAAECGRPGASVRAGPALRRGTIDRVVPWREIDHVVANVTKQLVGDTQTLVFGSVERDAASANEADPAWRDLVEDLRLHLPGAERAATWRLELVAPGDSVEVFAVDDRNSPGPAFLAEVSGRRGQRIVTRPPLALLAVLIIAPAPFARAADPPRTGTAVLACGPARLVARTTSVAHVGADDGLVWTAQAITLAAGPGDAGRRIPVEGVEASTAAGASGGMTTIVSSWACLSGMRGKVIELWISCNRTDLGGACRGEREWERLLDTTGRRLDEGYAPQDPRYEALSERLGVPTDGIRLEAATGD